MGKTVHRELAIALSKPASSAPFLFKFNLAFIMKGQNSSILVTHAPQADRLSLAARDAQDRALAYPRHPMV